MLFFNSRGDSDDGVNCANEQGYSELCSPEIWLCVGIICDPVSGGLRGWSGGQAVVHPERLVGKKKLLSLLFMRPTTVPSSANLMKRLELDEGVQSWVSSSVMRRGLTPQDSLVA